jgi:hypothetical protein
MNLTLSAIRSAPRMVVAVVAVAVCLGGRAARSDPPSGDGVRFEVFEAVAKDAWPAADAAPTTVFDHPAFALPELPARYDDQGLRADRQVPCVLRASTKVRLPAGPQRLVVRGRGALRVTLDGATVADLPGPKIRSDGHEPMFVPDRSGPQGMRIVQPGDQQAVYDVEGDGEWHELVVETRVGDAGRRPEIGEFAASLGPPDAVPTVIAHSGGGKPLSDVGWREIAAAVGAEIETANRAARRQAAAGDAEYWNDRHRLARERLAATPGPVPPETAADRSTIDRFLDARLAAAGVTPSPPAGDLDFIRRLSLDVRGIIPSAAEIARFLADREPGRRERLVDAFLADPRWADHWVGYWQDVLAENPNLVNPTLNNTGPFRFWIHESFLDDKPIDRFASEAIMMHGGTYAGGPGGFELATENDVPMAAKAHVVGRAFLGMEMNCARCHDAPNHPYEQRDLFGLAAMLGRKPQPVPATSSIPGGDERLARLTVKVTLPPGSTVEPEWPFPEVAAADAAEGVVRDPGDSRALLAALVTGPANDRFPQVIANRLWERYFGRGLVAEPDDWHSERPSHPELLAWLGRELVNRDYSLKALARLILTSAAYQRAALPADGPAVPASLFAGQPPRRMSAEQLVDSLFVACGKPFDVETMNVDIDSSREPTKSLNLGTPTRAWQFAALGNERDRPSLSLPFAQHHVTVMEAFGWRGERQNPVSRRDTDPNVLQPAILANGVVVKRASQFSAESAFTALAIESLPVDEFVRRVFLRILGRPPSAAEAQLFGDLVGPGYAARRLAPGAAAPLPPEERPLGVTWSNHLTAEADLAKGKLAEIAARGDPPSPLLDPDWRARAEDMVWTIFNAPEFVFIP